MFMRVGVVWITMDDLQSLCLDHGIHLLFQNDSPADPGIAMREGLVVDRSTLDPLRRSKVTIRSEILDIPIQDPRAELWSPDLRLVSDDTIICIVEVMDLGESILDPRYYSRIQNLNKAVPKGATLIGCDSSFVIPEGIEYVAHTMSEEHYPMNPIHTGCGLDLILIREIQGTIEDAVNAIACVGIDIATTLDKMSGFEGYG